MLVIVCIILYAVFAKPAIEKHTWVLTYAQQTDAPYFIVAHQKGTAPSDDIHNLYAFSKEIELTCEAKNGELVLTDETNHKTYSGTYEVSSWNRASDKSYTVVIDGQEGTATIETISSKFNRTLCIVIGQYVLNFEIQ